MNASSQNIHRLAMKNTLGKLANGTALSEVEAEQIFDIIMSGAATPAQIGGFLTALRMRGETISEIVGAVRIMRAKMLRVIAPENSVDLVGTGGDAAGTYNISTSASFVVAGTGIPVAKHGNRALSSQSGAADVLMALGVNLELTPDQIGHCIRESGIGFMFAPAHHSAMRHVGPVRVELGFRTIFNLLGPLSNPAQVKRQMVGVFDDHWLEPMAETLKRLGSEKAWIVHGSDGLDEVTTTGPTRCVELKDGHLHSFDIEPDALGIPLADPEALKGGDSMMNARALLAILQNERDESLNAYRDIVLLNAAATLVVADKTASLDDGLQLARQSLECGAAKACLDRLITLSQHYRSPTHS